VAETLKADWRSADLTPAEYAMLEYVEKLTINPSGMTEADVVALRAVGWTDRDILDIVQVCAYFNFRLRVVDALGLELSEATVQSAIAGRDRASTLADNRSAPLPSPVWDLDRR
jgi:uncharacterized peroxidase-related enzyme